MSEVNRIPPGGGVLRLDKPVGPTSHDMVARVRRVLQERRVGHTGTLDPFASGLLILCVGPATRLVQYLVGADKEYQATARLGVGTDTLDPEGAVVATDDVWRERTEEEVRGALGGLVGEILQLPPAFSAKKIDGEAAHRKARRGERVELAPVPVVIHELALTSFDPPDVAFRVRCSSGTYVRALARDLAHRLGTTAHLTALRRTRVGRWSVDDALPGDLADGIPPGAWIRPLAALDGWPRVALNDEEAQRLAHGQRLRVDRSETGPVVAEWQGTLLAICELDEGVLRPRRVFPPPETP
ncbi:MAG: tRNA pseudouridine(55) synthase TruB [Gemmatimonadota bacterium]